MIYVHKSLNDELKITFLIVTTHLKADQQKQNMIHDTEFRLIMCND